MFRSHPRFQVIPPEPGAYTTIPHVRLRRAEEPDEVSFGPIGYAAAAKASWAEFAQLRREKLDSCRNPLPGQPADAAGADHLIRRD